ncbi:anti-sigma factor [Pseudonocardia ailaonensis]|uniref:Regulator of SigK n=1 Tax=Pseudonocardia ailaonensis TaxID=367279 RepID=A0ABN2NMM7_9PSEU
MTAPCSMTRQVAGFALHALEPDEELAVLAHLPRCAECTATLRAHDEVLVRIANAAPAPAPPAHLRERILAAALAGPDAGLREPTGSPRHAVAGEGSRGGWGSTRPLQPAGKRRGARPGRRRLVTALLAAACTVAVGVLTGQAVDLQAQRDTAVAGSRDLTSIVTGLDAPGSTHATLLDGAGTAVAAVVSDHTALHLVVADLPGNDASSTTYVLWGTGAGAPQAVGTFDATTGRTEVRTLPATSRFTGFAVSREPGRVAPELPTTIVAIGPLTA